MRRSRLQQLIGDSKSIFFLLTQYSSWSSIPCTCSDIPSNEKNYLLASSLPWWAVFFTKYLIYYITYKPHLKSCITMFHAIVLFKGSVPGLVLKQREKATLKWLIEATDLWWSYIIALWRRGKHKKYQTRIVVTIDED